MNILVTGASGGVGQALTPVLAAAGHVVTPFDRRAFAPTAGFDAVVHLAGESVVGRWTSAKKTRIRSSRGEFTRRLCTALTQAKPAPRVFIAASAIGYYGDRGAELMREESPAGSGFLAEVVQEWEAATEPARAAGIRVVNLRIGVVLDWRAGALPRMALPFRLGLGGVLGDGRQYWSWIAIADLVGAIQHVLTDDTLHGPVNAVSPQPVTNREFTKSLGRFLQRPTIFSVPAPLVRLVFGEMGTALFLASTRVEPVRLLASGYQFKCPNLMTAFSSGCQCSSRGS